MSFTKEELNYLSFMLQTASPFSIRRAQEVIEPNVKHSHLKLKIEQELKSMV
jgi:hypothetical protein